MSEAIASADVDWQRSEGFIYRQKTRAGAAWRTCTIQMTAAIDLIREAACSRGPAPVWRAAEAQQTYAFCGRRTQRRAQHERLKTVERNEPPRDRLGHTTRQ